MSFFPGGRSQDKDPFSKKCQFYVEFLGWMECRGLRGQRYTDPVMRELRRRQHREDGPPKLTIEVSRRDVKITQDVEDKSRRGTKKVRFPSIPARDVTYVRQATRPSADGLLDDTVACIYLGYMPRTQKYVHVHVYRFDEARTATLFVNIMSALVENNLERIRDVEIDLSTNGEIDDPRRISSEGISEHRTLDSALGSVSSDGDSPTFGSDENEIDFDLQSLKDVQSFDNVTDELKFRLQMADTPLLLPPKDYDTIRRAHGNLKQINMRRCRNLNIVGEIAVVRERNGSNESGVDLNFTGSDASGVDEKLQSPQLQPTDKRDSANVDSQHPLRLAHIKDSKNYSGGSQTPANLNLPKPLNNSHGKPGLRDRDVFNSGHHSRPKSPDTSPITAELVYPAAKMTSPPTSPTMYKQPKRLPLSRQLSDNPKPTHLIEDRTGGPIRHYRSGSNNDIYAVPFRSTSTSHTMGIHEDEFPPDYLEDFRQQPVLRGMNQRYSQAYLARTLSDGPIRNDKILGHSSRPISVDLQTHQLSTTLLYAPGHRLHGDEEVPASFQRFSSRWK